MSSSGPCQQNVPPGPVGRRVRIAAVLMLFAVVYASLGLASYTRTSATWDEPQHLTAGYLALTRQDYRVDPEHPPFARLWAALPLVLFGDLTIDTHTIDAAAPSDFADRGQVDISRQFLHLDNDAERLLYAGRFMILLLGIGLGILIFCWAYEWLGYWPAVATLAAYTFEPNLAAHATLVTTDFSVTCFIFATLYFLWRTSRAASAANIAALALCFALALVSKFSALVLAPIVMLLLVSLVGDARRLSAARAAGILAVVAVASWMAIWAAYGFKHAPGPEPSGDWRFRFHNDAMAGRVPFIGAVARWSDEHHLLPNAFAQGFLLGQAKAQVRNSYVAGDYSLTGRWYYFPLAFAIKTPTAILVLLVIGGVFAVRDRRRLGDGTATFVVVPVLIYGAWAISAKLNIGLRHLLPIYPFVLLLATASAVRLLRSYARAGRVAIAGLSVLWLIEFGRAYPDTLAFFNSTIGGPARGAEYLVDSNLDWGQDLKGLKHWMVAHDVRQINLAYFGTADPGYYGIDARYLRDGWFFADAHSPAATFPGYVAVSETVLKGPYLNPLMRTRYRALEQREPVARIGRSIRVYWMERQWW